MEHLTPPLARLHRGRLLAAGLAMASIGFVYGYINTAVPILLSAQGVSVGRISSIIVLAYLPTSIGFFGTPVLDVWLSRRTYSILLVLIGALALGAATLFYQHIALFTALNVFACTAMVFFAGAISGWQVGFIPTEDFGWLGAFTNIANLGAAGTFGTLAVYLVRHLRLPVASALLTVIVMLPMLFLFVYPAPPPPGRSARVTFAHLFSDLGVIFKQRACLFGLIAFLAPCSCFALSNIFSSLGADFHTAESMVANITGIDVAIVATIGTLIGAVLCERFYRGKLYVLVGLGGCFFALFLLFTPHTPAFFAAGVLGYSLVQGALYTILTAFALELTGPNNPLAATQISVLIAAANTPILYMSYIEGHVHDRYGLNTMFALDALIPLVTICCMFWLLGRFRIGQSQPAALQDAS